MVLYRKSKILYSTFLLSDFYKHGEEISYNDDNDAVSHAVDYCIKNGILEEFFSERKGEVIKNMTIDITFERQLELSAIENRAEGKAEGKAEGEALNVIKLIMKKSE